MRRKRTAPPVPGPQLNLVRAVTGHGYMIHDRIGTLLITPDGARRLGVRDGEMFSLDLDIFQHPTKASDGDPRRMNLTLTRHIDDAK